MTLNSIKMKFRHLWLTKVRRQTLPTPEQISEALEKTPHWHAKLLFSPSVRAIALQYVHSHAEDKLKDVARQNVCSTERIKQILWMVWRAQYRKDNGVK